MGKETLKTPTYGIKEKEMKTGVVQEGFLGSAGSTKAVQGGGAGLQQ